MMELVWSQSLLTSNLTASVPRSKLFIGTFMFSLFLIMSRAFIVKGKNSRRGSGLVKVVSVQTGASFLIDQSRCPNHKGHSDLIPPSLSQ